MAFKPFCNYCMSWHRLDEPHGPRYFAQGILDINSIDHPSKLDEDYRKDREEDERGDHR